MVETGTGSYTLIGNRGRGDIEALSVAAGGVCLTVRFRARTGIAGAGGSGVE